MKYKLEWNYKLKGKEEISVSSDWIDGEIAILLGEDIEMSGKSKELIYYDETGTSWTLKEMKKLLTEIEEEPHDIIVFFDGGYNNTNQQSGLGAVVYYKQGKKKFRIRANEVFHELESNNEAEYAAMYFAVGLLEELGIGRMTCEFKGDAQGVLKQIAGEWPCYEETLSNWLDKIEEKIEALRIHATFTPIPRNDNKEAHKLAAQSLEGKRIHSKMQLL